MIDYGKQKLNELSQTKYIVDNIVNNEMKAKRGE